MAIATITFKPTEEILLSARMIQLAVQTKEKGQLNIDLGQFVVYCYERNESLRNPFEKYFSRVKEGLVGGPLGDMSQALQQVSTALCEKTYRLLSVTDKDIDRIDCLRRNCLVFNELASEHNEGLFTKGAVAGIAPLPLDLLEKCEGSSKEFRSLQDQLKGIVRATKVKSSLVSGDYIRCVYSDLHLRFTNLNPDQRNTLRDIFQLYTQIVKNSYIYYTLSLLNPASASPPYTFVILANILKIKEKDRAAVIIRVCEFLGAKIKKELDEGEQNPMIFQEATEVGLLSEFFQGVRASGIEDFKVEPLFARDIYQLEQELKSFERHCFHELKEKIAPEARKDLTTFRYKSTIMGILRPIFELKLREKLSLERRKILDESKASMQRSLESQFYQHHKACNLKKQALQDEIEKKALETLDHPVLRFNQSDFGDGETLDGGICYGLTVTTILELLKTPLRDKKTLRRIMATSVVVDGLKEEFKRQSVSVRAGIDLIMNSHGRFLQAAATLNLRLGAARFEIPRTLLNKAGITTRNFHDTIRYLSLRDINDPKVKKISTIRELFEWLNTRKQLLHEAHGLVELGMIGDLSGHSIFLEINHESKWYGFLDVNSGYYTLESFEHLIFAFTHYLGSFYGSNYNIFIPSAFILKK